MSKKGALCAAACRVCWLALVVSYLTPVSDLDLAPATDQFVASPSVKDTSILGVV